VVTDALLLTERLELRPLPRAAALAMPDDRETAAGAIGATLLPEWPQADLLDVLPQQAAAAPDEARFGVWTIVERETRTVVGDVGFMGPPDAEGVVEIGYSVVPDRRRRGYATEAARALVAWALREPGVQAVVAGCDQDNVASIRTLEALGFSGDGVADGQLRWRFREARP
jgi:[ribosomal protein S5]-alanine N-acetyltransferase